MPELPEVETIRRGLAPRLVGRRVVAVEGEPARLRLGVDPESWRSATCGSVLAELGRRGKYLLGDFGAATAVLHLGMSGRLVLAPAGTSLLPHTHLRVRFDGDLELRLIDPRRFGMAVVVPTAGLAAFAPLAALGVDALDGALAEALVAAVRRSRSPIRSLLLDQTVVAGIGNIYATEALARARIHPLRRASALSPRRVAALARAVREVLEEALAAGGTTLEDGGFADADGNAGYFAVRLAVYGREGEPCHRCATAIRRQTLAGRSVFFCPRCQH